jgi:hypothetical protein
VAGSLTDRLITGRSSVQIRLGPFPLDKFVDRRTPRLPLGTAHGGFERSPHVFVEDSESLGHLLLVDSHVVQGLVDRGMAVDPLDGRRRYPGPICQASEGSAQDLSSDPLLEHGVGHWVHRNGPVLAPEPPLPMDGKGRSRKGPNASRDSKRVRELSRGRCRTTVDREGIVGEGFGSPFLSSMISWNDSIGRMIRGSRPNWVASSCLAAAARSPCQAWPTGSQRRPRLRRKSRCS